MDKSGSVISSINILQTLAYSTNNSDFVISEELMAHYKRDVLFYGILFNVCRAIGVLPVIRNAHDEACYHFGGPDKDCFSVTSWSRMTTAIQMIIVVIFGLSVSPSALNFDTDTCLWVNSFVSVLMSLVLVLYSSTNTSIKYISYACKIYSLPSTTNQPFPILLFCILIVYPFVPFIYMLTWIFNMTFTESFFIFRKFYIYIHISAIEVVITTCCFIASRAYCDINYRLRKCLQLNFETSTLNLVKNLLSEYIAVCKFSRCFANVFSPHFLNSFTYLILRMIFFTINFIQLIKDKKYMILISYSFYAGYLIFRILTICFSCQNIHREIAVTTHIMRRLRIKWVYSISEDQSKLFDAYEELISSSGVEFTACGLFPVNTQQVVSVMGLIVTYGLVALQT